MVLIKRKHFYFKFELLVEEDLNKFLNDFDLLNEFNCDINKYKKLVWIKIYKDGLIQFLFLKKNKTFKIYSINDYLNNTFKMSFFNNVINKKYM